MAKTPPLDRLVEQAEGDPEVMAVFLFGSAARGEAAPSDVDVCLVLAGSPGREAASEKRLEYLANFDLDVQVFQSLPLPVRQRVLKEGRVLLSKDDDALYELAAFTIRACTYFRPAYETYLEGVRARS